MPPSPAAPRASSAGTSNCGADAVGELARRGTHAEEERELGVGHHRDTVGKREWRARRTRPRSKRPSWKRTATRT